jgi:prepilin-type N-terminal cleavage/methylation domain-containing protein
MTHGRSSANLVLGKADRVFQRPDEGFTFVETLVSIVILALVLAAVAPIAQAAVRSLSTAARESARLHRLALAYDAFRSSCEDTLVPPWISSASAASAESGGIRVAYLGGSEYEAWTLSAGDGLLAVRTPRGSFEVPADRARVERVEAEGRTVGLAASFESMGRTWTWKGYFGAPGH